MFEKVRQSYSKVKEQALTKCSKVGAVVMASTGSLVVMIMPVSADEVTLSSGLSNVKTLLDWAWDAITGNTFLFTIFCIGLASMAFGLMRSAKRAPR